MTRFYLLVFVLPLTLLAKAQTSRLQKEKEPYWVTVHTSDYTDNTMDADAEDGYIDLNYELQISLAQQSKYIKKEMKILSEAGVQNNSEISVSFDPTYQQLVFHSIKLIRGTQTLDKLQLSKFNLIQQEKDLARHVYDGSLTALLLLEDVRKGDVIEYSYTLKGFNPVYGNRYATRLDAQFSVPVYNLYYKLIIPNGRHLTIKNDRISINPAVQQLDKEKIYQWTLKDLAPLRVEDDLPSWYNAYPGIMVSEYTAWKDVADWASGLFPFDLQLSPLLQKKIAEIKANNSTEETRVLTALRFVQDDIRYMGIEIGAGSHRPNHPNKIIAQRFGDCKDKSYLLCTILRELGIDASPVLINTVFKKTITEWLPAPTVFDHCTVMVKLQNAVYWLDPTIAYQRGQLKDIAYPDYQCGLVVAAQTENLTFIPTQTKGDITVKEIFDVPDMSGKANLTVKTIYTGSFADYARDEFSNNSRFEMLKKYQGYYSSYFDNMSADSITYKDNESSGVFSTTEYYRIHDFWKTEKESKKASLSPYTINAALVKPDQATRTMPFGLSYPLRYKEEIEVNLPEDWNAESTSDIIHCASFMLKYNFTATKRQIRLQYEYESKKDFVSPDEIKEYLSSYKKVDEQIGYSLTYTGGTGSFAFKKDKAALNSGSPFPILYTILGLCVFITILVRRNKRESGY